jgi:hypothetical protein
MKKSIYLKKPILVEGKIIAKGAKIFVESEDIEDVGVVNTEDNIDYDVIALKRARKLRAMKLAKAKKGEAEVTTADENDEGVDFPADDIQALRKARKLRAMKLAKAKKADDEVEDEEIEVDDEIAERKARLRKIRAMKNRKAKRAEAEVTTADENDEGVDFPADDIQALKRARFSRINKAKKSIENDEDKDEVKKARLAKIRQIRDMKKAEDETTESDEIEEEDDDGVVAEKCGK